MYKIDRRGFLKLMGQGTAVLGIGGMTGRLWAAQFGGPPQEEKPEDPMHPDWSNWEFYFPGVYDVQDTKVLNEFHAELDKINNKGNVDTNELVSGNLEGQPGIGRTSKIAAEGVETTSRLYGGRNPMWLDSKYAKKSKWDGMVIPFASGVGGAMPAMPKSEGIGDYMVVSHYNISVSYYKPVYVGDTIYSVIENEHSIDITPPQGSYYRTFTMSGHAKCHNQKGELVGEGANIITESFRRHKDPAKRNPTGAHAWESPDWWSRKPHMYTDADWDEIISIWKNEKIRGSKTLYWDDVNIGDEPPPMAIGPIVSEVETDMLGLGVDVPQWSIDTKLNVLDPKIFAKMVKNKQGIYVFPEYLEKMPAQRPFSGADTDAPVTQTPELSNRDGRAVLMNAVAARWAGSMIMNWMGDNGWLQRIGWDFMEIPPGVSESISYDKDPTMIPSIPDYMIPALFEKRPYLEKVPYMRGTCPAWHPMEGDLIICKAYVTDKYRQGEEYFVDLTWWCETLDNYLVEEGFATIKLPKK